MTKEKSCGAVVCRHEHGKTYVLLIKHKNGGHWAFPKGHVENSETERETALREIKEETGLDVDIDSGFRKVVTYSPKPDVIKDVVYFAANARAGKERPQPEEIAELKWEEIHDAVNQVTYGNDKELLTSLIGYL